MAHVLMNKLAKDNGNKNEEYLGYANSYDDMIARMNITSTLRNVEITEVRVIHNNYLRGMYELKKLEYMSRYGSVEERTLIHSTSACNVMSIIGDNLDWRRVKRNRYGKGVSFSPDADYANYHSNDDNGYKRAFIIASVLVSRTIKAGNWKMKIPPNGIDTSVSNINTPRVYVKYNDNEFLLKYVVYYNRPDPTESAHHRN